MTYNEFKNNVQKMPLILTKDVLLSGNNKQATLNQLNRWQKKKLLFKLKRGVFILNPNDRKINPSKAYIANQLYGPSYVSLEYALNYYGLIPERVADLTSVTSKKTMHLKNGLGDFVYLHIKTEAFRSFKMLKDEAGLNFFIAEPEKAVADFIYLNIEKFKKPYGEIFEESYRFQNLELLRPKEIIRVAGFFDNDKLMRVSEVLCKLVKKEKRGC